MKDEQNEQLYGMRETLKLLRQIEFERNRQEALFEDIKAAEKAAADCKQAYDRLLNSRSVRLYLKIRRLLGYPYKRLQKPLEKTKKGSDAIIRKNQVRTEAILAAVDALCPIPGCAYYAKSNVRIGLIADEFNWTYLKDAADIICLTPENYRDCIDHDNLDFVFYMSTWRGVSFFGGIDMPEAAHFFGPSGREAARVILRYARNKDIPIVFQSIEDPPSYATFLKMAKEADVIFTSAVEKMPDYKNDACNERIYIARYGVNPYVHSPIGFLKKPTAGNEDIFSGVLFAGAWYSAFRGRCRDMRMIFDGVLSSHRASLTIADRTLLSPLRKGRVFPRKYNSSIIPPLSYRDLQTAHKLFDWTINLNSVTDSATMCARRVYEVQALGGLLLTNYSLSMSRGFPGAFVVHSSSEVTSILDGYTLDELVAMQIEGIRGMYDGCTVYDRLNEVFEAVGLEERFPVRPVYVVCGERDGAAEEAFETLDCPGKVLLSEEEARALEDPDGFMVRLPAGARPSRWWLLDMVNAFKFTDGAYVSYVPGYEGAYDYARGTATPEGCLFDLAKVPVSDVLDGSSLSGLWGFSVVEPRWGRDTSGSPKDLAVVVPVHNSGRYLWGRCFRSLLRSSVFDRMRVYLVDDGSTDGETERIVRWMAETFDNVEAYFFGDGGSGSAARPRNKGVEMASEPYIAFIDPDDEAVGDGYAELLADLERTGADFALGSRLKVSPGSAAPVEAAWLEGDALVEDPRATLVEKGFQVQNIQGAVYRRDLIVGAGLREVEGGLGEDTLFFYELMCAARSVWHRRLPVFVYYADREDSATGRIDASFFERSMVAEREQVAFLRREGLLEAFREIRLAPFMDGWYREKLSHVGLADLPECAETVREIGGLYE